MAVEAYRQGRQTSLFFPLPQGQFWAQIFPERKFRAQICPKIQGIYAIFCSQRVVTNASALATADTMARFRGQICLTPDCAQPIFCSNLVPLLLEDLFPKLINNQSGRTGLTNFRI